MNHHIFACPGSTKRLQIDYLDTVVEGVEVSRQDLGDSGSGFYRWTITFLDEGDDFDLAVPPSSGNQLSTTEGGRADGSTAVVNIEITKVR